jgi:hypothetical protein
MIITTNNRTGTVAEDCASRVFCFAPGVRIFNLTAVIIDVIVGLCLIAVRLSIEPLVEWFQRRSLREDCPRLRWLLDVVFR